jgi:hypothetical protein
LVQATRSTSTATIYLLGGEEFIPRQLGVLPLMDHRRMHAVFRFAVHRLMLSSMLTLIATFSVVA